MREKSSECAEASADLIELESDPDGPPPSVVWINRDTPLEPLSNHALHAEMLPGDPNDADLRDCVASSSYSELDAYVVA